MDATTRTKKRDLRSQRKQNLRAAAIDGLFLLSRGTEYTAEDTSSSPMFLTRIAPVLILKPVNFAASISSRSRYTIQREQTNDGKRRRHGERHVKKTYTQEWPAYNAAQVNEKDQFQSLLHELCKGIGEPSQKMGRPRLPLEDMIFSAAFKVYSTVSGRRFMSDLARRTCQGLSSQSCLATTPSSTTLKMKTLTPYLKMLIEESSLPLTAIESDFAVDSSGFSTCRFVQWVQAKYTTRNL